MSPALYEQLSSYYSPVWFLYEPVRGQGVINTPDWCFSPLPYKQLVSQRGMSQILLVLSDYYKLWLSIQVVYGFGHHDPSSGKPLGHFQVLICRNTNHNGLCINRSPKWNKFSKYQATQNMLDGMADKGVSTILLQEASK